MPKLHCGEGFKSLSIIVTMIKLIKLIKSIWPLARSRSNPQVWISVTTEPPSPQTYPPKLSQIGPVVSEIQVRTNKQTNKQTNRQTDKPTKPYIDRAAVYNNAVIKYFFFSFLIILFLWDILTLYFYREISFTVSSLCLWYIFCMRNKHTCRNA